MRTIRQTALGIGLILGGLLLTGCCSEDGEIEACSIAEPPPQPSGISELRIVDGDGQVGPVDAALTVPLVVRVSDPATGDGRYQVDARFEIEAGGGRLAAVGGTKAVVEPGAQALTEETDSTGFASARLVLGPNPGENRVVVRFVRYNKFLRFAAVGHGPAARVEVRQGDGQSGEVGAELADPVSVKITDASGVQIPGMRVWFVPQDGGLPLDGEVRQSSRFGVAEMSARWRLGPATGTQRLIAQVLDGASGSTLANLAGNPITFTATARPAAPARVARNPVGFPEPQQAPAGKAVASKPSVRVTDAGGNGIGGVPVRFAVTSGGETLGGLSIVHERPTDADGVLTVPDWILGAPGANTVTATVLVNGVTGNPVVFSATATEFGLAITAGNNQTGPTNTTLPVAPQVRVTGVNGAGVAGIRITWTVIQGSGSFLPLSGDTDANGYAVLDYFGPMVVGPIQLRASTNDPRVSPQSVVFALGGAPRA